MASPSSADIRPLGLVGKDNDLTPGEEQFARWMALQTTRVDEADELTACRLIFGQDLTVTARRTIKKKLAWKQVYQNARAEVYEHHLKVAKGRAMAIAPKAMKVLDKAVEALDQEFDRAKTGDADAMAAVRSAPSLLIPFLDRALPKKTESETVSTKIEIRLTPEQAKGLGAPVAVIEAEEVKTLPPHSHDVA